MDEDIQRLCREARMELGNLIDIENEDAEHLNKRRYAALLRALACVVGIEGLVDNELPSALQKAKRTSAVFNNLENN